MNSTTVAIAAATVNELNEERSKEVREAFVVTLMRKLK